MMNDFLAELIGIEVESGIASECELGVLQGSTSTICGFETGMIGLWVL